MSQVSKLLSLTNLMNDKQAEDLALSSSPSTQPKSFISKDYIKDSAHQPRSPAIDQKEQDKKELKPSPTNKEFLDTLKTFNIEKSRYKHYGYQSLMTSQQLDKIVDEAKKSSTPTSNNRLIIDERISEILGLPQQVVEEEDFWPYNVETLNEILRYKVEQEKTRQESAKNEFGCTAIELLKIAKSMNINGDLIPLLFVSPQFTINDLKDKIHKLRNEPDEIIHEILHKSKEPPLEVPKTTPPNGKRKFSDTQLPSFSETAESIKTIVSPLRSPNKLPVTSHRRVVSDSSEVTNRGSNTTSPPTYQLPLPPSAHPPQHRSQQHLPQIPAQPPMYPVYYSPGPGQPQGGAPGYPAHQMGPPASGQPTQEQQGKALGSPYSQKYNQVMYDGASHHGQYGPGAPGYVAQPQYQYFVPPGSNPGGPPSQYMMPVPAGMGMAPPSHAQVPTHQFASESTSRSSPQDDISPYKKQKSTGKTNNINFMITTPKNPPARKYNNPNKEK
ncbi:uncharacterized protein CANTADRAFT_25746 [Suhomyces tanzawaensis NRRL Y-17324]|uniref:Uncharacterized protein n=1 Tax=Suhomyces tanzawaensis NRRL Y-17324 TaxID=984487 RepID=A0A1E4SKE3_9ASCO|nr:uncharacterized protein CANTADRAFT_25746 [Suhomyces tanzawaensis NRRL Y-17324]ODV79979.1 hypothetical protein CANTADRAFT_25746 [Suhomyces tanzawaensis NRRL Y-17324]